MRVLPLFPPLFLAVLLGCPSASEPPADDDDDTPFVVVPWPDGPPTLADDAPTGLRPLRVIAHLHSHWSHDACDGDPQPGGIPDELCLGDLRRGLCLDRIDVAFLSDHPTHATETDYDTLLLLRDDDEPVQNAAGDTVGNRLTCPGGHQVLLLPGVESGDMMPLGLDRHMPGGYVGSSAADFAEMEAAGALKWIAHTEQRDVATLATLDLDGIELYQLHANLAPDIRGDYLGLDPFGYLAEVGPFFFPEPRGITDPPHPDLAPLGFLSLNEPSILALETLGQTQRIAVTGGSDAHQNVFPSAASDGERIDSYRRMLRWFNNRLLVPASDAPVTPDEAEAAMRAARNYVVFEVFGTPLGFDLRVERAGAVAAGLGDELTFAAGDIVVVDPPTLDPRSARADVAPETVTRLYFADGLGRTLLAEAEGDAPLSAALPGPGVVRVEVWIRPSHLAPYLGEVVDDYIERLVPWIQTGGIFLR